MSEKLKKQNNNNNNKKKKLQLLTKVGESCTSKESRVILEMIIGET